MGNRMRLDTGIVFLLFAYVLMFATPTYCAQTYTPDVTSEPLTMFTRSNPIAAPCFTVTTHPDDPPSSTYNSLITVNASGVAFPGTATTSTTL